MFRTRPRAPGFTPPELLLCATILMVRAGAVVPMAKNAQRRQREVELIRALREMRKALDDYKAAVDGQKIKPPPIENNGYPESLDVLIEGVPMNGKSAKIRFLRRIPVDPTTGRPEWGFRSVQDDATSTSWGGGSVFDVYSKSEATGSNGIPYKEW